MPQQSNFWTRERVERLKTHWDNGLSASQIGDRLGCSRNAVIGKVTRLRLSPRLTHIRKATNTLSAKKRHYRFREPGQKEKRLEAILKSDGYVPKEADVQIPLETRKTLETLTDYCCRWPVGDPSAPGFYFCGMKRVPLLPYCASHSQIAYVPVPAKKRKSNIVPFPSEASKREEVDA